MSRPHPGTVIALALAGLSVAGHLHAQVIRQEPSEAASIWRKAGNASTSPGAAVPLETNDPRFQAYFSKVRAKIKDTWTYPRAAGERGIQGEVVIEFRIAKDGRLESAYVQRSSGATVLDEYSLMAVQTAAPFPPVPDDVAKETLTVDSTFRYFAGGRSPQPK
jgi:TonB family protein